MVIKRRHESRVMRPGRHLWRAWTAPQAWYCQRVSALRMRRMALSGRPVGGAAQQDAAEGAVSRSREVRHGSR